MSQSKKIFIEAHNIKNMFSGFGQFNYWLLKNMIANNENFELIVNARSHRSLKDFDGNFTFHKYYALSRYTFFRSHLKYHLWHSLNQNSKIEPRRNGPYLLTFHDVIFIEKDKPEDVDQKKLRLLQEKVRRSTAIAFISEYAKKSANNYLDIPSDIRQTVIYNGNPITAMKTSAAKPETSFSLEKPFLFCIGQFLEMKNFHSLVGMLSKLKDFQLVLAGNNDKPYAEVVRNEIEKYNLQKRVFLPGKISDAEKHYYLQNCAAFVFPSLFEGFGLPPIEAMAYGKPVFLANRTSLPEIAGPYGFYWDEFEPDSMAAVFEAGMQKYNKDYSIYNSELRKRAQFFDWDTTAKKYLDLYNLLLNEI